MRFVLAVIALLASTAAIAQPVKIDGGILYRGANIYAPKVDPVEVRRRIGMVFQKPNPFPKSIRDNIIYDAKVNGIKGDYNQLVERALKGAALCDEVKGDL